MWNAPLLFKNHTWNNFMLRNKLKNKSIVMVLVQFQNINICFCDLVLLVTYKTKRNFE